MKYCCLIFGNARNATVSQTLQALALVSSLKCSAHLLHLLRASGKMVKSGVGAFLILSSNVLVSRCFQNQLHACPTSRRRCSVPTCCCFQMLSRLWTSTNLTKFLHGFAVKRTRAPFKAFHYISFIFPDSKGRIRENQIKVGALC